MRQGLTVYPTARAVLVMAAGAPLTLMPALVVAPGLWSLSLLWIGLVLLFMAADLGLGPGRRRLVAEVDVPARLEAGGAPGSLSVSLPRRPAGLAVDLALEADPLLAIEPAETRLGADGTARFGLHPRRRGRAEIAALHLRWRGPLGLVWKARIQPLAAPVEVWPNVSAVREAAVRLATRSREEGGAAQRDFAASLEFHALREFRPGDGNRAIVWRQSARHGTLLVRETRAERNRTVIVAVETGRLMCEPIDGDVPRVDHAVNAALLTAFAALRAGDRVGLFTFAAQPRMLIAPAADMDGFGRFQKAAASIEYSDEEPNYALGLSALNQALHGRSLVLIFTEFADTTSARLMMERLEPMVDRHVVLFVAFRDAELDGLARARPATLADVTRAVVAGELMRERDIVLGRLRRMGVDVIETPARSCGPAIVGRYLALKREDRF